MTNGGGPDHHDDRKIVKKKKSYKQPKKSRVDCVKEHATSKQAQQSG